MKSAKGHDSTKAMSLCGNLESGEIIVFDKAYIKFKFLHDLTERGVFWVGTAKDNMDYETMGQQVGQFVSEDKQIKRGSLHFPGCHRNKKKRELNLEHGESVLRHFQKERI